MVKWLFRGWGWVDPMKEVQSAKEAIRAGLKTQSQVIAEMGGDLEELLMARKNEIDMAAELGLEFDTEVKANTQESSNIEPRPNENYEQA
jgi:capsid protein